MTFGLRSKIVTALVLVCICVLLLAALFADRALDRLRADLGVAYARDVTLLKQARITAPLMRDLALSLRMADSDPIREWLKDEAHPDKRARAFREMEGYRAQFASRSAFVISAHSRHYYFNNPREPISDQPRYTLDPEQKPSDRWFPSVLDMPGLSNDLHFAARGTFVELENPQGFRETLYAPYVKMSRSRTRARPGPMIGQDNDRILKGLLGLSESRYAELVEKQVIY